MGFLRQDGSHFAWQSKSRKCRAEQTCNVPSFVWGSPVFAIDPDKEPCPGAQVVAEVDRACRPFQTAFRNATILGTRPE